MRFRIAATTAAAILTALTLAACSGPSTPAPVTVPVPAPAATAVPAAVPAVQLPAAPLAQVAVPELAGQNGAIAEDALRSAGFTNIRLAADAASGKQTVLLPENWTVTKVEPTAGTQVAPGQLVVLTMTK